MVEGGALRSEEFREFAKDHVTFLHVTTRIPGRKHDDLLQKKGGRGFPYFCMLDAEGSVIAQHAGERTVEGFRKTAAAARRFVDLRTRAAAGDREAKIDFCLLRGQLGQIAFAEVEAELKPLGELSEDQTKVYRGLEADAMVKETLEIEVGKRFAAMLDEGLVPQSEEAASRFWHHIQVYAEATKDARLLRRYLEWARERFRDQPQARPFLESLAKRVEELERKG